MNDHELNCGGFGKQQDNNGESGQDKEKLKNKQTKTVMVSLVKIKQINKQTKQQDNNGRNPYNAKSTK